MSARQKLIGLDDPAGWRKALQDIPHGFAHTWDCCNAIARTSGHATFLYYWERDGTRALCPLAERKFLGEIDVCTPFGFSGFIGDANPEEARRSWLEFARSRNYVCGYFALHPRFAKPALHSETTQRNTVYYLDLSLGTEELLRRMSAKRRRAVKAWRESGLTFLTDRRLLTEFLINNHEPFMRSVGASERSLMTRDTLELFCASPSVDIVGVGGEGVTAIHAFAATAWEAESLFFLAKPEGRPLMTALYWEAVEISAARGIPRLSLGGGVRPDDSIAFAKRLYGAEPVEFRCAKEIYRPEVYARLCGVTGVAADLSAQYFPPYRTIA